MNPDDTVPTESHPDYALIVADVIDEREHYRNLFLETDTKFWEQIELTQKLQDRLAKVVDIVVRYEDWFIDGHEDSWRLQRDLRDALHMSNAASYNPDELD